MKNDEYIQQQYGLSELRSIVGQFREPREMMAYPNRERTGLKP